MSWSKQSYCKRGHAKTTENTIRTFNGRTWYAKCKACQRLRYQRTRKAMTPAQRAAFNRRQRQYALRFPERVADTQRRYKHSAKGKAAAALYRPKYLLKNAAKLLAQSKARSKRNYSDPAKRARILSGNKRWRHENKETFAASCKRWRIGNSENAKRYARRHSMSLPANAPDSLCETVELLRAIRKETKREYKRT